MSLSAELRAVSMFASLSPAALDGLIEAGRTLELPAGAIICREGERDGTLFVIRAGQVRIVKQAGEDAIEVARLGAGVVVGELALLDDKPRSASAICVEPCRLFAVQRDAFMALLVSASSQATLASVFAALVDRVRTTTDQVHRTELARQALEAERHRGIAEMVAGVAHELNTPLGVANTGASVLLERLAEPEIEALLDDPLLADAVDDMREAAGLIQRNLARAHGLVEQFKHVAVGHFVHATETVDLVQFVEEVLTLFHPQARRAGLAVELTCTLDAAQRRFVGETGHLTQIITNLLANIARHAYDAGGPVHVRLARAAGAFVLTVADEGRGISVADQAQVFTPFFTTRRGDGGTGLGMAIVQAAAVDGLGGSVSLASTPGEGTVVTVRFPAG